MHGEGDAKDNLWSRLEAKTSLTSQTFELLKKYGFDCDDSLMAMDVNKDIQSMSDITLGQRAIIRQMIVDYKSATDPMSDDKGRQCSVSCMRDKELLEKIKTFVDENLGLKSAITAEELIEMRQSMVSLKTNLSGVQQLCDEKDETIDDLETQLSIQKTSCLRATKQLSKYEKEMNAKVQSLDAKSRSLEANNKSLEAKVDELKLVNQSLINGYNSSTKACFNGMKLIKKCLQRESMAVHKDTGAKSSPAPVEVLTTSDVAVLTPISHPKASPKVAKDLIPQIVSTDARNETKEVAVPMDRSPPSVESLSGSPDSVSRECVVVVRKLESKAVPTLPLQSTPSVAPVVSAPPLQEPMSVDAPELSTNSAENAVKTGDTPSTPQPLDTSNGYTKVISNTSAVMAADKKRPKRSSRIHNKKLRRSGQSSGDSPVVEAATAKVVDQSSPTHIVMLALDESDQSQDKELIPAAGVPNQVTLSTITASRLPELSPNHIVIDINGQSDAEDNNNTDIAIPTDPKRALLRLKQFVDSADTVSQISTSNGYLSNDSNQENRCSVVNTTAPSVKTKAATAVTASPPTTAVSTRSSTPTNRAPIDGEQPEVSIPASQRGFKCHIEGCVFVTGFKRKFDDHLKNHVAVHFGDELPDYWKTMFNALRVEDCTANTGAHQISVNSSS